MATPISTPGVYIEEIRTLPASVAQVATAIPAFIGYTAEGPTASDLPTIVRITSLQDYQAAFGGPESIGFEVTETVAGFTVALQADPTWLMYPMLQSYFANGGGPCYIVSLGDYAATPNLGRYQQGIVALETEEEPTLLVFPDATSLSSSADFYTVQDAALAHCVKMQDRFALLDTFTDEPAAISEFRDGTGADGLKYGAAYFPYLQTTFPYQYDETAVEVTRAGDTPVTVMLDTLEATDNQIYNQIKSELDAQRYVLPPSAAMAGIYARVDAEVGVWKAPANVSVRNVVGPTRKITNAEQAGYNVDPTSGKSINAIRAFTGKGTLVWGARTLAGNDNEWRYVNVRRLFITVEESVQKATSFAVFEPNDANTWVLVRAMIENYLTDLWKDGALAGARPDDAFFVKIGLGESMTAQDILEGRMNVEIGLAAVRPAEFIILKFSHLLQKS
ncbi:MAG: phage tail sheath C-terminal domain-containing protein [Bacteroidota bacterium]